MPVAAFEWAEEPACLLELPHSCVPAEELACLPELRLSAPVADFHALAAHWCVPLVSQQEPDVLRELHSGC